MKRITITIPSYWSQKTGDPGYPEDSVFDHPTPINEEGTLGRCLESLKKICSYDFQVLIITAPVNPDLSEAVEQKIEKLISPFRKNYPIAQFCPSDLMLLKKRLEAEGIEPEMVSLSTYAQIRNCQLIGSVLLDTDLIAAIDDDEIVPENYLQKAVEFAGKTFKRKNINGVGGIYLNSSGDYKLKESPEARISSNLFKRKAALMNDEFSSYMRHPERLVETAIVLGGNMIFSRDLFMQIPFDPGITRGEDIDYLLNSRMLGYSWYLDKELQITHLPPSPSEKDPLNVSPYSKLQQDIIRFTYQREKIKLSTIISGFHPLKPEDFGYYPGEFLRDDLEEHALKALKDTRPPDADQSFFPKPEKLIEQAKNRAAKAGNYYEFKEKWKQVIEVVDRDWQLKEHMKKRLNM